jgi:D-glycero-beta-D-manno-heptose 1-phosphate adenylyltransferase
MVECARMPVPDRIKNFTYIEDRDDLPWLRPADFKNLELPRPLVIVNGGFDLLHAGHFKLITRARRNAATLVCALDSDTRVARKDPRRPIQTFIERATMLAYAPIDYLVEIDSDKDMYNLILIAKPDLRVQGPEHRKSNKYPWVPKAFVSGLNRSGERVGMSTTEIVRRVTERYGN